MKSSKCSLLTGPTQERGVTLIELLVSITIGLFLIGGLLTLVQGMKRATASQSGLSQLQDNERMAMSLMTDVIQSTGYFIDPRSNSATSSFPVATAYSYTGTPAAATDAFAAAGQAVSGSTGATSDTITVRYMTTGSTAIPHDNVINCTGNTSTAKATFINTFSIDANNNLQCLVVVITGAGTTVNAPVPLIAGLQKMTVLYGVVTNTAVSNNSVDTYLKASAVTDWTAVKSAKVTLYFVNPLYGTSAVSVAQYIPFTRIIALMGAT